MIRKYVVQINQNQQFPFQSANPLFLEHQVKVIIQVSPPYSLKFYRNHIYRAIQLECINPYLVHLQGVIEHKNLNKISLSYEHVPYSLKDILNSNMDIKMSQVKQKIRELFYFLLENGIFPKIQSKNIGFSRNLELKYFLLPNFKQVNKQKFNQNIKIFNEWIHDLSKMKEESSIAHRLKIQNQIGESSKYMQQDNKNLENLQDTKSFRFSQKDFKNYNTKFQKKITQIQNKIFKLKGKNIGVRSERNQRERKKQLIKNSKNPSFLDEASDYSSSHSQSLQKQKQKHKNEEQNNQIRRSFNHNSHTDLQQINQKSQTQEGFGNKKQTIKKEKMTNSWIFEQQNKKVEDQKPHKSSWGDQLKKHKSSWGDYSTSNPNQSQKQFFLKRRISTAFQKSSYALKVYEKYQTKKQSRKFSGKKQTKKVQ